VGANNLGAKVRFLIGKGKLVEILQQFGKEIIFKHLL
jgi:hypothetical protein